MADAERIELVGTREERWEQAIRLAYSDVTEKALGNFYSVYKEAGITPLPTAVELYKKYGGVFKTLRPVFGESVHTSEFAWRFCSDLTFVYWAGRKYAVGMLKSLTAHINKVRKIAKQEVCPVGTFGYYYPPHVYIGEDGRFYCVYDYTDAVLVFDKLYEIVDQQIGDDPIMYLEPVPDDDEYDEDDDEDE